MKISEFEQELRLLNKDLSIRVNNPPERVIKMFPDVVKLCTITLQGVEVCTIPTDEIYDEPNGSYGVDLRNDGRFVRHRTRPEAIQIVKDTITRLDNKDYADMFYGRGEYSDEALRRPVEPAQELVEEVPIQLEEVKIETLVLPSKEKKELE